MIVFFFYSLLYSLFSSIIYLHEPENTIHINTNPGYTIYSYIRVRQIDGSDRKSKEISFNLIIIRPRLINGLIHIHNCNIYKYIWSWFYTSSSSSSSSSDFYSLNLTSTSTFLIQILFLSIYCNANIEQRDSIFCFKLKFC